MQYSLSRLTPSILTQLKNGVNDPKFVDGFFARLEKFLDGEKSSVAEQDLAFSTAAELSSAGIMEIVSLEKVADILSRSDNSKAAAFQLGLPSKIRSAIEEILSGAGRSKINQVFPSTEQPRAVRTKGGRPKRISGYLKLQVPAGTATPAPPIGPALGQRGLNIMEFCKAFNAATLNMEKNSPVPTVITIYSDKSFTFVTSDPSVSHYLKMAAGLSGTKRRAPGRYAWISTEEVRLIAEQKMQDLNVRNIDQAIEKVRSNANSLGIQVEK